MKRGLYVTVGNAKYESVFMTYKIQPFLETYLYISGSKVAHLETIRRK